MKRHLLVYGVLALALLLQGCTLIQSSDSGQQVQPEPPVESGSKPLPSTSEPIAPPPHITGGTLPVQPSVKTIDWAASVSPLVEQMNQSVQSEPGSVLLIDNIKNDTNGNLNGSNVMHALHDRLGMNKKFTLINDAQLSQARQSLGLTTDDSFNSPGKAIGLARYLNAKYVLYSTASGEASLPKLAMQLMLVQTGEILWSGMGITQY